MRICVGIVIVALFFFAGSGIAFGRISDSWNYWLPMGLDDPNVYFDHLQMKAVWPGQFLTPVGYENGIDDGNTYPPDESWSQTYNNGTLLLADGNETNELYWQTYFADANEVLWHLQAWDGNTLVVNQDILKEEGEWWTTPWDSNYVFEGTWQACRIDDEPNPADIYLDGYVDIIDFAILALQWMGPPDVPSADIAPKGGDGIVDYRDLSVLVQNWLF